MTSRLDRNDLRRVSSAGNPARLPGRSLARTRGVCRQALIGAAGGLACAGGLSLQSAVGRLGTAWTEAADRILIVVPDPSRLAAVLSAAGPDARRIEPGQVASLLGGPASVGSDMVLAIGKDGPGLAARVEAVAPGSIVAADGAASAERLAVFGDRLRLACAIFVGAIGLASAAALAAGAHAGVLASAAPARLLHDLGATNAWISRHLIWPLAAAAAAGTAIGVAAMDLYFVAANLTRLPSPIVPGAAFPLLAGAATALFASFVARRRLGVQW